MLSICSSKRWRAEIPEHRYSLVLITKIVNLGSFQEMLFDHNLDQTLSIRVGTTIDDDIPQLPYKENRIAIEFRFKRPSLDEVIRLDQIRIYDGRSAKCIAKFRLSGKTLDGRIGVLLSWNFSFKIR